MIPVSFPPRRASGTESVPTTTHIQYLGSMINWEKSFDTAFKHRAGTAESSCKKNPFAMEQFPLKEM